MGQHQYAMLCDISRALLSLIELGRRTPPPEKLDRMAEVLGLQGTARAAFIRAGHLAHTPDVVNHALRRAEADVRMLTEDNQTLRAALAAAIHLLHQHGIAPPTLPESPAWPDDPFAQCDAEAARGAKHHDMDKEKQT
jgi:transcriptional regulator with XRE-family HTH domain